MPENAPLPLAYLLGKPFLSSVSELKVSQSTDWFKEINKGLVLGDSQDSALSVGGADV